MMRPWTYQEPWSQNDETINLSGPWSQNNDMSGSEVSEGLEYRVFPDTLYNARGVTLNKNKREWGAQTN